MGEDYVVTMCHHIEDPTFDATATATNPRARMRPVHRPPRIPADRHPHCAWTVTVDPAVDPLPMPLVASQLAASAIGELPIARAEPSLPDDDGWNDYRAPLDPDLSLERFSSRTLSAIADEIAVQGQLLSRAFLVEVAGRVQPARAVSIGIDAAAGIAGLTAKRLAAALGVPATLGGLAEVLTVHPLLLPATYVAATVVDRGDELVVTLDDCPALDEPDGCTWPALLAGPAGDDILRSIAVCVVPSATVERVAPGSSVARWSVRTGTQTVEQPASVTLAEFSTGAAFTFRRPR